MRANLMQKNNPFLYLMEQNLLQKEDVFNV